MTIEEEMREKLMRAFDPAQLDITNESEMHAGHGGSPGTGESHFRILIVSDKFTGVSRVLRHRMVNDVLKTELAGRIHALALQTTAPAEAAS